MSNKTLIAPTTSAVTTKTAINTSALASCVVTANLLAGAEEVDIFVQSGATWMTLVDLTGTPVKLTATITMVALEPGPTYAVTKDATVGACGVYLSQTRRKGV